MSYSYTDSKNEKPNSIYIDDMNIVPNKAKKPRRMIALSIGLGHDP